MNSQLLFFAIASLLAISCFIPSLAGKLRLPYTVLLAIVGTVIGLLAKAPITGWPVIDDLLLSLHSMNLSSQTLLMMFLPILLFETSMKMNFRKLFNDATPIMTMAVVAVFVTTILVGVVLNAISHYGIIVCLLLGSIVATTDPVAVLGIFKEVGAPRRLITLLEGESLLNDAAALALYSVLISALALDTQLSVPVTLSHFLYTFLAGAFIGWLAGQVTCFLIGLIRGFSTAEITLTIGTAFLTYFIGEHYLHVSGVVATVVAGLVVGNQGRTRMSPTTFEQIEQSWDQFGFWANSFIFLLASMLIPDLIVGMSWQDVILTIALYLAVLLARGATVFGLLPLLEHFGLSTKIDTSDRIVMCWGGLRGAISLALALSVTEQLGVSQSEQHFITGATTLFVLATLLINGLTLRPLIKKFKLGELTPLEKQVRNQALIFALDESADRTCEVAQMLELDGYTKQRINAVFHREIEHYRETAKFSEMDRDDQIAIGLAMLSKHEEGHFFDLLKAQVIPWQVAQILLNDAERLSDAAVSAGRRAYVQALRHDLRYTLSFRFGMWLHSRLHFNALLSYELSLRVARLLGKHGAVMHLIQYCEQDLKPLLGEEISAAVIRIQQARLQAVDEAITAMTLTYPEYVKGMRVNFLGRIARAMEVRRYRQMMTQSLISPEIYAELIGSSRSRWDEITELPRLDVSMSARELMRHVPLFEGLDEHVLKEVSKVLKPRLVLPQQLIYTRNHYMNSLYFIASGAVSMTLADDTRAELGTGQMFGEMVLLRKQSIYVNVRSLGYTRLLILPRRDFRHLMKKYPTIKQRVNEVMDERLYALKVWEEHQKAMNQLKKPVQEFSDG